MGAVGEQCLTRGHHLRIASRHHPLQTLESLALCGTSHTTPTFGHRFALWSPVRSQQNVRARRSHDIRAMGGPHVSGCNAVRVFACCRQIMAIHLTTPERRRSLHDLVAVHGLRTSRRWSMPSSSWAITAWHSSSLSTRQAARRFSCSPPISASASCPREDHGGVGGLVGHVPSVDPDRSTTLPLAPFAGLYSIGSDPKPIQGLEHRSTLDNRLHFSKTSLQSRPCASPASSVFPARWMNTSHGNDSGIKVFDAMARLKEVDFLTIDCYCLAINHVLASALAQ